MPAATCPKCSGTGFNLSTDDGGVVTAVRCECAVAGLQSRLQRSAGIPRRYSEMTFDTFEIHDARTHGPALEVAREWVERFPAVHKGLLFIGEPGTGKTHLAVAIIHAVLEKNVLGNTKARFHEQRSLLKALQGTFDAESEVRESEVLGDATNADLLVLDDVGAGRTTPWARDVLHDLIVHRYNEEKPLVMTTNLAMGDRAEERSGGRRTSLTLLERLGDALISRLHEMCRIVRFGGDDYRKKIRANTYDL